MPRVCPDRTHAIALAALLLAVGCAAEVEDPEVLKGGAPDALDTPGEFPAARLLYADYVHYGRSSSGVTGRAYIEAEGYVETVEVLYGGKGEDWAGHPIVAEPIAEIVLNDDRGVRPGRLYHAEGFGILGTTEFAIRATTFSGRVSWDNNGEEWGKYVLRPTDTAPFRAAAVPIGITRDVALEEAQVRHRDGKPYVLVTAVARKAPDGGMPKVAFHYDVVDVGGLRPHAIWAHPLAERGEREEDDNFWFQEEVPFAHDNQTLRIRAQVATDGETGWEGWDEGYASPEFPFYAGLECHRAGEVAWCKSPTIGSEIY
jgi:hypothetical protein